METRYYIADKKTWSDVTVSVNRKNTPKKGDVVNVGKVKMTVKDVVDDTVHGKPVTKVMLESTGLPFTQIDEAIEQMENPIFLDIVEEINEATRVGGHPSDKRTLTSPEIATPASSYAVRAYGPGTAGTFGGYVRSGLANLGVGYGVQVSDFGEAVTVSITYSNAQTGKCSSQNYVIIWRGAQAKYAYTVYSSSVRFRHCNDYNQAIAFIRSKASSLPGRCSGVA